MNSARNTYTHIRIKMRLDEQEVLDHLRREARKTQPCGPYHRCSLWPEPWMDKATRRLEAAGVIYTERHFGRRSYGVHYRVKPHARPITTVPHPKVGATVRLRGTRGRIGTVLKVNDVLAVVRWRRAYKTNIPQESAYTLDDLRWEVA